MSAVCGVLSFGATSGVGAIVDRMTDAMRSAGPDTQTRWDNGRIALGHCLLRTTPESQRERQPVVSPCGSVVLVWDGRLDNRAEIEIALRRLGHSPRDPSDAELALQSYLAWNTDCPSRFLGDFALGIWDGRRRAVFCARDHVGARPLHYAVTDRSFAFASVDEALLQVPGVSPAIDQQRVAYFLVPQFQDFDMLGSWYRDVRVLGAGQSIEVHADGRREVRTFWRLREDVETTYASDEDCVRGFLDVFDSAVQCRLRASGDVALMLSGGVDSAAILATADALGTRLHTYSTISTVPEDEIESSAILTLTQNRPDANFLSLPSCTGVLDRDEVLDTVQLHAHPVDRSVLLPALMCRAAAGHRRRVVLTGLCGDLATHSVFPHIARLLHEGQWRQAVAESFAARRHTYLHDSHPLAILTRNAYRCFAPLPMKRFARKLRATHETILRESLVHPDFAARLGMASWLRDLHVEVGPLSTDAQSEHIKMLGPPHGTAACMGAYNRVASRWGVEVRDPWADRRVLEFWLRLPTRYKCRDGWTKYLARRAFAGRLPAPVVDRHLKKHVGWNVAAQFMTTRGPESPAALEAALSDVDNFVDIPAARRAYGRYLATGSHEDCTRIFDVLTLSSWVRHCRTFVE